MDRSTSDLVRCWRSSLVKRLPGSPRRSAEDDDEDAAPGTSGRAGSSPRGKHQGCHFTRRNPGLYHRSAMIRPREQTAPETLLDLLDAAFERYSDRPAVRMWQDDGTRATWTYAELEDRSRLVAWRLRNH